MAVLERGAVFAPVLPKETVHVAALGGDVVVRGLRLSERLSMEQRIARLTGAPGAHGATDADVNTIIPGLLGVCVLASDGAPLWTEDDWQAFGAQHKGEAVALFNAAWRLSGFDQGATVKN